MKTVVEQLTVLFLVFMDVVVSSLSLSSAADDMISVDMRCGKII